MKATALFSALAHHFDLEGGLRDFGGRIYPEAAPSQTALPFAVARTAVATRLDAYEVEGADVIIVLELFGRGYHDSAALADAVADAIRDDLLTLDDGICYHVNQMTEPTPMLRPRDEYGDDVWQWTISYQFGVQ
jgi:hypothetical protein